MASSNSITASKIDASVAEATLAASAALVKLGIAYAVIGGQALRLLGSGRSTWDVDILVDIPALEIRPRLIEMDSRFSVDSRYKLVFKSSTDITTDIELLQGGPGLLLALPGAAATPKFFVGSISVLHPSVLIITKIKRWVNLAESTRPKSVSKANSDLVDIKFLVHWLDEHRQEIDFESYAAIKPKEQLLPGFSLLYRVNEDVRDSLQRVLPTADFNLINT